MLNNSTILTTIEDSFIGFQAAMALVQKGFKVYTQQWVSLFIISFIKNLEDKAGVLDIDTHQSFDRARKTSPNLFKCT